MRGNSITKMSVAGIAQYADAWSTIPAGTGPPGPAVTAILQACQSSTNTTTYTPPNSTGQLPRGFLWADGDLNYTFFNTIVPPNSRRWQFAACKGGGGGPDGAQVTNATSNHSGGVNVLMADGSVRFLRDSVAWAVWWGLGTKDNGEAIDQGAY